MNLRNIPGRDIARSASTRKKGWATGYSRILNGYINELDS